MLQEATAVMVIMLLICNIWVSRDSANRHTSVARAGGTIKSQLWVNEKKHNNNTEHSALSLNRSLFCTTVGIKPKLASYSMLRNEMFSNWIKLYNRLDVQYDKDSE